MSSRKELDADIRALHESDRMWRSGVVVNPLTSFVATRIGMFVSASVESFVFVATTGRSGSKTISAVLSRIEGCTAFHEPWPRLHGAIMVAKNRGDAGLMKKAFRLRKLPRILWYARRSRWYVETSHMFIKAYADEVVAAFEKRARVIHLVRAPDAVASSLLLKSTVPGTEYGSGWTLDPAATCNILNMQTLLGEAGPYGHPYFRCLWYWYETEARVATFRRKFPEIPVFDIRTEDLDSPERMGELFRWMGIPLEAFPKEFPQIKENASEMCPRIPADISESHLLEFHERCIALLSDLGLRRAVEAAAGNFLPG